METVREYTSELSILTRLERLVFAPASEKPARIPRLGRAVLFDDDDEGGADGAYVRERDDSFSSTSEEEEETERAEEETVRPLSAASEAIRARARRGVSRCSLDASAAREHVNELSSRLHAADEARAALRERCCEHARDLAALTAERARLQRREEKAHNRLCDGESASAAASAACGAGVSTHGIRLSTST